ncbi:MAG: hypoxanthine phosphoribosyltransferase [Syntrophales bacterium]|nr:hypoxanthine phosphoribosyltransferase [Syntrophales bacterium]
MEKTQKEILYSREDIKKRVEELARQINADYKGKDPVIIGILKGAFVFMADLIRHLEIPCTVDFIRLASYGSGSISSGEIKVTKDIETDIKGKDVLVVEDIIDTGLTLRYLVDLLRERGPSSLKVCALIDKRLRRRVEFEADYVGFTMDDGFVVGYGLDYNEQDRSLPDVYIVKNV